MELMRPYEQLGDWYHHDSGIPHYMNRKLDKELSTLLFRQAPIVSFSLLALLGVVLYFFWGKLPQGLLLTWAGVNLAFALLLLLAAWQYTRRGNEQNSRAWINGYTALVLCQDVAWGMIGPLSFMLENHTYHLLTLFMLAGMSAGALTTRGVVFRAYAASAIALLTPAMIALLLQENAVYEGMLVLTVIYLLFMLSVARSYSGNIRKNILLWLDNEKLVRELRHSSAEVADANKVLMREIEQRIHAEEQLVEAKERAEQASAAKNQFLASVSHELRTPLNGIIGFTSILEKEPLNTAQQGYVGQIGKSAHNLLRIVNDILDITSIEAGHMQLYEEPFSLRTEIGEVMAILTPVARRRELRLESSIEPDVCDWLQGDASRLRQIVSNLLSNALKYTEEGEVRLHISQSSGADGQGVLHFEVSDTGIGIPDEAIATLFDNFTRAEGFELRHSDGVGLGLAIVKNLVLRMQGRVSVSSEPGQGSCFRVELPLVPAAREPQQKPPQELQHEGQLQRLKVLVVDDNKVNRMVLAAFLKHHAIPCSEAASGAEALELIRQQAFDVVLLDIQMPDISGLDVAQALHEEQNEAPMLVAVTAHAFPEQRQEILAAGFSDLLIKPVSEDELLRVLCAVEKG